ncbi:FadR family transcriptional regulator [Paenibacillus mesophilus]|uniref:FadR/GntR family transcriptional regulator n=1 Tax=Paenibacillus mesophilus TaxID=2582849 RepID=UPI00110EA64D|nr:FadR/GntR family transcriptional regulator [Paenibacillus mesophilus]TMV46873.1 FadR family transcriptional regulator [Paenibacillus mesophilus]
MDMTEKTTLTEVVKERIKKYIIDNQLPPGAKLPTEKQLTEMLLVSRTVVRMALQSLQILGILRIRAGGGIFVDSPKLNPVLDHISVQWMRSREKLAELLATRKILELGAIEMAVQHRDLELIGQLDLWNDRMEQAIRQGKIPIEEDFEFHRALFKATGNQTYVELNEVIGDFFRRLRELFFDDIEKTYVSLNEHKQITEKIKKGDAEEAKAIMRRHLDQALEI